VKGLTLDVTAGSKCDHFSDTRGRSTQQHRNTNEIHNRLIVALLLQTSALVKSQFAKLPSSVNYFW